MKEEILRMEGIRCEQNGVTLIEDMRITLRKAETMGLLIKNAHRRSSVVSLLCGQLPVDSGRVYFDDRPVAPADYAALCYRRVAFVGGRSELIDSLSVAENIFIIRPHARTYLIRKRIINRQAEILLGRFGVDIPPGTPAMKLTTLERMLVQLIKAYAAGARIVVIGDVSRTLGTLEIDTLMRCADLLKKEKIGVFLVDAYWDVLSKFSDRLSVFSSRSVVKVFRREDFNEEAISILLEEPPAQASEGMPRFDDPPALRFENVCTETLMELTFSVHPREIVCILDTDGSGMDQIVRALMGEEHPLRGEIWLSGKPYTRRGTAQALRSGLGFIGDNPTHTSLFRDLSVMDNLSLPISSRIGSFFWKKRYMRSLVEHGGAYFSRDVLSGRTLHPLKEDVLQRIVYVRWRLARPRVLAVVRPLSVTDAVGSRITREMILDIARAGSAVLVLSSNWTEARQLGHRILELRRGRLVEREAPHA